MRSTERSIKKGARRVSPETILKRAQAVAHAQHSAKKKVSSSALAFYEEAVKRKDIHAIMEKLAKF